MRVKELLPGMVFQHRRGFQAVYITQTAHPMWPNLQLVIWRLHDEGGWHTTMDALDTDHHVGTPTPATKQMRAVKLRQAMHRPIPTRPKVDAAAEVST